MGTYEKAIREIAEEAVKLALWAKEQGTEAGTIYEQLEACVCLLKEENKQGKH